MTGDFFIFEFKSVLMKSNLFFGLLFFLAIPVHSQTLESLKLETLKFHESHYYMDFIETANLTYPKIIETTDKEKFITQLDSESQNADFRKRIQLTQPVFQYGPIKKIGDQSFCLITYKNPTRYFFEQKLDVAAANQKVSDLKKMTKATEVIFEPIRNSINVKRSSKLVAVADDSTENKWKFFNFDDPIQQEMFLKLYSENIKKQLGL